MSNPITTPGEQMSRRLVPLAALALIAMAVLISACGSSAPAGTAGGSGGSGGSGGRNHAQAVKFAECMRHNGVSAFPDPPASGNLTIDAVVNGSSLNPSSPAFTQALSACKTLEPAGFTGQKATPQQTSARLKFAQCMRANGVPDFPDPTPNGPLLDTRRIPSLAGKNPSTDPALQTAMHKCSNFAAAAGVARQ
jgi:hypothetical protein